MQDWLGSLPPEPKRRIRTALRDLGERKLGDIKPLEAELAGFYRLRVGGYRIVFSEHKGNIIRLQYADLRELVYEQFLKFLKESAG